MSRRFTRMFDVDFSLSRIPACFTSSSLSFLLLSFFRFAFVGYVGVYGLEFGWDNLFGLEFGWDNLRFGMKT